MSATRVYLLICALLVGMAVGPNQICHASGAPSFNRGDVNGDTTVNISDAIFFLTYLFPSGPPFTLACEDAGDINDDGSHNVADAVYLLTFLFSVGAPAPPGHPLCVPDGTTGDPFDCLVYP